MDPGFRVCGICECTWITPGFKCAAWPDRGRDPSGHQSREHPDAISTPGRLACALDRVLRCVAQAAAQIAMAFFPFVIRAPNDQNLDLSEEAA